jgi:TRAP transporter TAXI family solute receptor
MAKTGTGLSKGTKYENLMLAANLMVFRVGPVVGINSGINKLSDLKGKNVPAGFKAAPLFNYIVGSFLANANVSAKDTRSIPVVALRQHWNMFKEGKIDVVVSAVGTGVLKELNAAVPGGIKYLTMDDSPDALARTKAAYPGIYLAEVKPAKPLTGVLEPVKVLHFDYLLWTHKGANPEVVYKTVKAMYENEKDLKTSSPLWRSHASKTMAKKHPFDYHPGALKFYKEVGLR